MQDLPAHLILARVLEATATPLSQDVARVYFEMRKSHAPEIDVFTRSELQWGAMKVAVLGTFYDQPDPAGCRAPALRFGGDVQNFLSPHMYSAHVPTPQMLQELINAFVDPRSRRQIGSIRLAESVLSARGTTSPDVAVFVSPTDFIGSRTALFGKTRMGKSNTVKLIARMVLDCGREPAAGPSAPGASARLPRLPPGPKRRSGRSSSTSTASTPTATSRTAPASTTCTPTAACATRCAPRRRRGCGR